MIIDSHSHLTMLEHDSLENILKRAKDSFLSQLITVSTEEKNWEENQKLSAHSGVYFSLGLHPHEANKWATCKEKLLKFFEKGVPNKCVGIGEMGFDFYYNHSTEKEQEIAFIEQVEIAKNYQLPVIFHCREAFKKTYDFLRLHGPIKGVMHCFTGNVEQAKEAIDLGLKISFSGILTFKNATTLQEVAKNISLSDILIETDCPFLSPVPMRGKPNEPSFLIHTAEFLSELLQLSKKDIFQNTSQNTKTIFSLKEDMLT